MGHGDDSYTAWDGRRYEGLPPDGWFLAADNRWWPSPDLIDQPEEVVDPDIANSGAEPTGRMQPPASAVPAPDEAPVTRSQTGAPRTPGSPIRLGRKGARRIAQALVFLFFFRGCIGVPDIEFNDSAPSPALTFELAAPEDYEVTINPCAGNAPTGQIRNNTATRLRFNVILEVSFGRGLLEQWTSAPTLPAAPGALVNWRAPVPEGSPLADGCEVLYVESKPVE